MAFIDLQHVNLIYPLRVQSGLTLKEFFLNRLRNRRTQLVKQVHALRDLSFHVGNGERVGLIGRNGAGKTTLLRTMAGIYPIASGDRNVEGSICSLLDINVGLEADATGWENIHYRGYLQGETPETLKEKTKAIAEFTELGEFMDLPIRCYSAGMNTRLAFAIATSSDPEILFVDEIFGAGDLAFQKKAEQRMQEFMHKAKIVVMVGHQLPYLREFCQRIVWVDRGGIKMDGDPGTVIDAYREEIQAQQKARAEQQQQAQPAAA